MQGKRRGLNGKFTAIIVAVAMLWQATAAADAYALRPLPASEDNRLGNWKPGAAGPEESEIRLAVEHNLAQARRCFSDERFSEASQALEPALKDMERLLSRGCERNSFILACYYNARVMKRMLRGYRGASPEPATKRSTQILLLDPTRQSILLQVRGPFKRLFAGKRTVSANAKPENEQLIYKSAASAVKDETGLEVNPASFIEAEPGRTRISRLVSLDFIAVSAKEETALRGMHALLQERCRSAGIKIDWDPQKRSLCVFSVNPRHDRSALQPFAKEITDATGIPPVYPVFNEDRTSTLLYVLTPDEEKRIRETAHAKREAKESATSALLGGINDAVCKALDSDDMIFERWMDVKEEFGRQPQGYALDLTGPAFGDESFWEAVFPSVPFVMSVDAPEAVAVAGGKGANMHILRKLAASGRIPCLNVPDASVVTTYAYRHLVLGNDSICKDIELLESTKDEVEIRRISQRIREAILRIELPGWFRDAITSEFRRLGGDIAVRSSATVEDIKGFSGAGLAESFLHITNAEEAHECVKRVWASLFSDGFVNARNGVGFSHENARMAVLLQKFIDPKAAGVVFTIHSNQRPLYVVTAQPGIGEGTVQGKRNTDEWEVGFMADAILEKSIARKTYRVTAIREGGTKEENIDISEPSLTDDEVLEIARAVKLIQRHYRSAGLADELDVEYAVDADGVVHIVQARSKASFATDQGDESVFLVNVVDEANLPSGTKFVELAPRSTIATYGAVTARLQVLKRRTDLPEKNVDRHLAAMAQPGVILVTHHTSNEFNGVFSKLAGVITCDGNMTAHAAQNSAPLKIPCMVGVTDAFEKLTPLDGQLVTFDAGRRKIYIGAMPIIEEERRLGIWNANAGEPEINAVYEREPHEIFQRWETTRRRRPNVYKDYPEDGHLRWRSGYYREFELDYYYRAWDRLTALLNRLFEARAPWTLQTQDRVFKWYRSPLARFRDEEKAGLVRNFLCHRIVRNDPRSVFYYVQGIRSLTEDDLQDLFDARWRGFQTFARFMNSIEHIDAGNVERVIDELIDVFVWMHMGFWLDVTVNHLFAHDQLRYVNPAYYQILKNEAVCDLPRTESVDSKRPDVPAGKILKLSRRKDKEMSSLVERIWSNHELVEIFEASDPAVIKENLAAAYPEILQAIESWSGRFKETSEYIEDLSDTDTYIEDIRGRVMEGIAVTPDFIASLCLTYMAEKGKKSLQINEIRHTDEDLYLMIRGYVRVTTATAKTPSWEEATTAARARILTSITEAELEEGLKACCGRLEKLIEAERGKIRAAQDALQDFPRLKKAAALAHQEFLLREDGHHLIVPHQRKIAHMMLEVGERYRHILGRPDRVFDIATDEVIALLLEPHPEFVMRTIEREQKLLRAEERFSDEWTADPAGAVGHYAASVSEIQSMLGEQATSATVPRVRQAYLDESERLAQRILWLKDTLKMMTLKELLNARDVLRENVKTDVLLICGNNTIDVFAEAVELYAAGRVKKILISGGLGSGTLPLIRSALIERIPIRISDMEIVSHENHIRRLESLEKSGRLREALKVSEADIISQIMRSMAENHTDNMGNRAPVNIREGDVICETQTTNIREYFTNCRPILHKLRDELGIAKNTPLVITYMHHPAIQFRTKCFFETTYEKELNSGIFRGVSYTLEHDIYDLRRESSQELMLKEMFGIVIYSQGGHMIPIYNGKRGLGEIPRKYWQAAAEIIDSYQDKNHLRAVLQGMISGLVSNTPLFPSDIGTIVKSMPDTADSFGKALLRLYNSSRDSAFDAEPVDVKGRVLPATPHTQPPSRIRPMQIDPDLQFQV